MKRKPPAFLEASGRRILFAAREDRIKPGRDEKILTEWNGLMIHALAECVQGRPVAVIGFEMLAMRNNESGCAGIFASRFAQP